MKSLKTLFAGVVLAFSGACLAGGSLSSINNSIANSADNQVMMGINQHLPFVVSDWAMLANYYSQNSSFPSVGIYAVSTTILSGVNSISNTAYGTLDIIYGPNAPGPLANNGFSLAPTRVTLRGNIFYVYELPQCFTNITDSMTSQHAPQTGTPIGVFSNSNLGVNCLYAPNPSLAAIAVVEGTNSAPPQQGGVGAS